MTALTALNLVVGSQQLSQPFCDFNRLPALKQLLSHTALTFVDCLQAMWNSEMHNVAQGSLPVNLRQSEDYSTVTSQSTGEINQVNLFQFGLI